MANKITGTTDTSGALTTMPTAVKSALIVAPVSGTQGSGVTVGEKEIFSISGTADATDIFGSTSIAPQMVKVLISNGVDNIKGIIVPTPVDEEDVLGDTLMASMEDKTVKMVLCADNQATTIAKVKDHLILCEQNDMFRYSVFAPSSEDAVSQTKLATFARSVNSDRIFVAGAELMNGDNAVDPQITASGLAGAIMTETDDPALPMNGVPLAGFTGVKRKMLDAEMKALANAGVTAITLDGTTPTVYRLVTSKVDEHGVSDAIWQEGTTRFIADYVLESNMTLLRANYKRTKNVQRVLDGIKGDIKINMEKMEGMEIIENWNEETLTVTKDPKDLYGALVDYEFDVVTPLYTITITQHMKL